MMTFALLLVAAVSPEHNAAATSSTIATQLDHSRFVASDSALVEAFDATTAASRERPRYRGIDALLDKFQNKPSDITSQ